METKKNCSLCRELAGSPSGINPEYDEIIHSGKNLLIDNQSYAVVPSIGALCSGHVLLCPKSHIESFRLYNDNNSYSAINHVRKLVSTYFKSPVAVFEHSAGKNGDCRSACIDHAHIHFVPTENSLLKHVKTVGAGANGYYNFPNTDYGYTYLSDIDNSECILHVEESQYLRKIWSIANHSTSWNWRNDHAIENILRTIETWEEAERPVIDSSLQN